VKYRVALILLLAYGALTPLYELNRSIYRTIQYAFQSHTSVEVKPFPQGSEQPIPYPELDHPSTLTADLYPSLTVFKPDEISNFAGKKDDSFFFKYLAKPPED
jgi:hypothetical protein